VVARQRWRLTPAAVVAMVGRGGAASALVLASAAAGAALLGLPQPTVLLNHAILDWLNLSLTTQ